MKKVKVYGAGSIGNHLSYASRQMGWRVDLCDINKDALERAKNEIYPSRYGKWDDSIGLYGCDEISDGNYDLVVVGTPPDSHMTVARSAIKQGAKTLLVEKPLCTPDLKGAQQLFEEANEAGCTVFVGYDHAVGKSATRMVDYLMSSDVGEIQTLDVEFREHWGGIFKAHPWLNGPNDTYLGYWKRGGGACGEHSHAINLWQRLAHQAGKGRVVEVSSAMEYVRDGVIDYDSICLLHLVTEDGFVGRVVQDVVTRPTRKWARAQCENGYVEWYCGNKPGLDTVECGLNTGEVTTSEFTKTRPSDFIQELKHIESILDTGAHRDSPISLARGLDTMLVIAAAHLSAQKKCSVKIDYSAGYKIDALSLAK
jgi:predicted dehydrogenase